MHFCLGFGNIGKKLGEAWQALPEKEKMVCIIYFAIAITQLYTIKRNFSGGVKRIFCSCVLSDRIKINLKFNAQQK